MSKRFLANYLSLVFSLMFLYCLYHITCDVSEQARLHHLVKTMFSATATIEKNHSIHSSVVFSQVNVPVTNYNLSLGIAVILCCLVFLVKCLSLVALILWLYPDYGTVCFLQHLSHFYDLKMYNTM